jgi:hypothetical protein
MIVNEAKVPSSPTKEELLAFGGFSEASINGIRSSDRVRAQPYADDSQMERAMRLAKQRDYQGTALASKLSISYISDDVIISRAQKLGVSLGTSANEVATSIKDLKDVEKQRELTILERNKNISEDDPHNLFVSKVSGLCEDLTEEDGFGLDDHTDQICPEVKSSRGYKKKAVKAETTKVRRSARIRKKSEETILK